MVSDYEQQVYGFADQEFNIGSPAQLGEVLFDKLQLPKAGIKHGKTGLSTAATELDKLRGQHPHNRSYHPVPRSSEAQKYLC